MLRLYYIFQTGKENAKNVSCTQAEDDKYKCIRTNKSMPGVPTDLTQQVQFFH